MIQRTHPGPSVLHVECSPGLSHSIVVKFQRYRQGLDRSARSYRQRPSISSDPPIGGPSAAAPDSRSTRRRSIIHAHQNQIDLLCPAWVILHDPANGFLHRVDSEICSVGCCFRTISAAYLQIGPSPLVSAKHAASEAHVSTRTYSCASRPCRPCAAAPG